MKVTLLREKQVQESDLSLSKRIGGTDDTHWKFPGFSQ